MSSPDLINLKPETTQQLARFIQLHPKRLQASAQISPRIAQLSLTFPLLFAQLSNSFMPYGLRVKAVQSTVDGAPLRDVAALLGVPYCLRYLPPETCPKFYRPHHWSAASSRSLRPFIPTDPQVASRWLSAITFAARLGDEAIALWIARHQVLFAPDRHTARFPHPLILFAWFSRHHPELVAPCETWTPNLQLRNATVRCFAWIAYVKAVSDLGLAGLIDPWISEDHDNDLHVVPLTTAQLLCDEARIMNNCLVDYSGALARNECRVFSVRLHTYRVATMEVRRSMKDKSLYVHQLLGPGNLKCPLELWQQAIDFVALRGGVELPDVTATPNFARQNFQGLLRPYISAMNSSEHRWLSELTIARLEIDLQHILLLAPWKRR